MAWRRSDRRVATRGVSHEYTLTSGLNLCNSLNQLGDWEEAKTLMRDLLPAARRSLGADHELTLKLNKNLAAVLHNSPECTRDDPRLNRR